MINDPAWPSNWLRGVLDLCVLRIIAAGPTYGYAIAAALEAAGLGAPKGGTLYPLLGRFERDNWVESQWSAGAGGPGRKFYSLTETGRGELASQTARWSQFAAVVSTCLLQNPAAASSPKTAAARDSAPQTISHVELKAQP
ncbi:MAG: helix-turn-helix transcriptional regulator [Propionibacteriaceae bacterium]|jgi:PadR family transcriptional regulator PadR|nr:helix-turn-helix transcriptional regulator [Propionibacteriaceae bacterium]